MRLAMSGMAAGYSSAAVIMGPPRAEARVAELRGRSGQVLMVGLTAHPEVLASAAADGTVRSWSLTGQKQLAEVRTDASLQAAAFDGHTRIILAASASGTIAIRMPATRPTE